MPIYVCSAATGRLTPVQKTEIARSITGIYHEVIGAPCYFVRVMFHDIAPGNNYVAGRPALRIRYRFVRHPERKDQRAEEPNAATDNSGRRPGQRRRRGCDHVHPV
jgi:phenylpyruvate tautomerase PptA (4-oxalocrotonate tautomerase family)